MGSTLSDAIIRARRVLRALPLLLAWQASQVAFGEDPHGFDIVAHSSGGEYEAKATTNDRRGWGPFTISLEEVATQKVLWRWEQTKEASEPAELLLAADGTLIILNSGHDLLVVRRDGTRTVAFNFLEQIPAEEDHKFVMHMDHGILWKQFAIQGFFPEQNPKWFYVRTYWGRIMAVDLQTAKRIDDPAVAKQIEDAILARTRAWVGAFNGEFAVKCSQCSGEHLRYDLKQFVFVIEEESVPEGRWIVQEAWKRREDGSFPNLNALWRIAPHLQDARADLAPSPVQASALAQQPGDTGDFFRRNALLLVAGGIALLSLFVTIVALSRILRRRPTSEA